MMKKARFTSWSWAGAITFGFGLLIQGVLVSPPPNSALIASPIELRTTANPIESEPKKSVETGFKFAGVKSDEEVVQFWSAFQRAIAMGDKESAAKFANYPLNVNYYDDAVERRYRKVNSEKAFVQQFDRIFDEALKGLIAKTSAKNLMGNYRGIRVPRGEIWIGVFCVDNKKDCSNAYEIKLRTIHANSAFIDRDTVK